MLRALVLTWQFMPFLWQVSAFCSKWPCHDIPVITRYLYSVTAGKLNHTGSHDNSARKLTIQNSYQNYCRAECGEHIMKMGSIPFDKNLICSALVTRGPVGVRYVWEMITHCVQLPAIEITCKIGVAVWRMERLYFLLCLRQCVVQENSERL